MRYILKNKRRPAYATTLKIRERGWSVSTMVSITHAGTHLRAWRSRDVFDDDRGRRDVGVAADGRRRLVLYGVDDVHP